ncbi:hypothetical protein CPB85DRAFT_562712 [Mucidula mucida]|nr:hypothetical protein CPB85DRAFT_562712 [Mucidula mucida]
MTLSIDIALFLTECPLDYDTFPLGHPQRTTRWNALEDSKCAACSRHLEDLGRSFGFVPMKYQFGFAPAVILVWLCAGYTTSLASRRLNPAIYVDDGLHALDMPCPLSRLTLVSTKTAHGRWLVDVTRRGFDDAQSFRWIRTKSSGSLLTLLPSNCDTGCYKPVDEY